MNKCVSVQCVGPLSLPVPDSTIAVRTAHNASGFRLHFETVLVSFQYNTKMKGTVSENDGNILHFHLLYNEP